MYPSPRKLCHCGSYLHHLLREGYPFVAHMFLTDFAMWHTTWYIILSIGFCDELLLPILSRQKWGFDIQLLWFSWCLGTRSQHTNPSPHSHASGGMWDIRLNIKKPANGSVFCAHWICWPQVRVLELYFCYSFEI